MYENRFTWDIVSQFSQQLTNRQYRCIECSFSVVLDVLVLSNGHEHVKIRARTVYTKNLYIDHIYPHSYRNKCAHVHFLAFSIPHPFRGGWPAGRAARVHPLDSLFLFSCFVILTSRVALAKGNIFLYVKK
jgi:hypothetical protein